MEPGKAYLIFTVDWFAWVGRMVRQIGPWEYEFDSVSKFDTNAGDVFGEIAAGDESLRKGCTYQHFKGLCILGQGAVGKIPWEGKTPQEAGLGVEARRRS